MGKEVEDGRRRRTNPQPDEHVAELTDRGVGKYPLYIVIHQGDGGRDDGSKEANNRHRRHGSGGELEYRITPGYQVDARSDHCGGVDEGTHGGGRLHGIGQPRVERHLGRLAHCPTKYEEGYPGGHDRRQHLMGPGKDLSKIYALKLDKDQHYPQTKKESPKRVTTNAFSPALAADCL